MNVANNEDFKKNMKKLCVISQNFLVQDKMYNLLTKSYYCVMENTTVNAVNAAKTTLWQSNVWNVLNFEKSLRQDVISEYIVISVLQLFSFRGRNAKSSLINNILNVITVSVWDLIRSSRSSIGIL